MPFECPTIPCQIHATCVVVDRRGLLIVGRAGVGKSALALQLMAIGAELVADDRCNLSHSPQGVVVSRPENLPAAIEARGVGILSARCTAPALLAAVIDLDCVTHERLPALRSTQMGDQNILLLESFKAQHFPAALLLFLKHGFHGSMGV
jgi:HPr kinase/phosphorylase